MNDVLRISDDVKGMKREVKDTEERLKEIRGKHSIFSESGRQSIVRECLAEIKPKLEGNLPKFSALAENIKKLWNAEGVASVREEFREVLSFIKGALEKMVSYGAQEDKDTASKLCGKVDSCLSKVG